LIAFSEVVLAMQAHHKVVELLWLVRRILGQAAAWFAWRIFVAYGVAPALAAVLFVEPNYQLAVQGGLLLQQPKPFHCGGVV
jgi:hypothetical protein